MGHTRRHHYVPRLLLRGFASPPTDHGKLFVFDAARKLVRPSTPAAAGYQSDYYLVPPTSHPKPLAVEDFYAKVESDAAPVLQQVRETRKLPPGGDLGKLIALIAIQFTRTPPFRRWLEGKFFESFERQILKMATTADGRRRFAEQQQRYGLPEPCWTPEGYLAFHKSGHFSTRTDDNWKIAFAIKMLPVTAHVLEAREWCLVPFSDANEPLVISDSGVGMFPIGKPGPKLVGLGLPNTVVYLPVSPRLVLAGYFREARRTVQLSTRPRFLNSCSFAMSLECCFSSSDDFVIEDGEGASKRWTEYQRDGKFPKLMDDPRDLAAQYASK